MLLFTATPRTPRTAFLQGVLFLVLVFALLLPAGAAGAFGFTTSAGFYTVDTGGGLVFKVRRTDNASNTQSAGDLMSLVYNGVEYQDPSRGSQINSGCDFLYGVTAVGVSAATVDADTIKITVEAGNLTHYYLARRGLPHIYMATYFITEPDPGLCRYIVRVPSALLTNGPAPSDIRNNTGAIESADIFGMADGTTRSKHYSNMRLKDWSSIGATDSNVGLWMVRSNHEGDSGGPFYRSLLNQCGTDQEITYILNYGEAQTEPFRTGILNGPYALVFTNGSPPPALDTASWIGSMGLFGYVAPAGRGSVTGSGITARDTSHAYTVGFANTKAQYWTSAAASNGAFNKPDMLPGTYTMNVYKNELVVYSASVVVDPGATTSLGNISIINDASQTIPLWRIGNWDGTPAEFLNGDKVTTMHPSDVRMSAWNPGPYVVGSSTTPATGMPCYQWKDVNGTQVVQFNLTPAQKLLASTVRIGITVAYEGARPKIAINSWNSANPAPSSQPDTRSLTVGTYRGNNTTFTFAVPASALLEGVNTLYISPISGSGTTGFLSAGYSLDCIEMFQGTEQKIVPPGAPPSLSASAGVAVVSVNWAAAGGAASYNVLRATVSGGPYTVVAAGLSALTYTDAGLNNGTTYYYVVSAANSSGTGLPSAEASATPYPPLEPVATYALEGSATDSSGHGNHGTPASLTYASGIVGAQAGQFNGTSSSVSIPRSISTDFTVSLWAKTTGTGGTGAQWWSGRGLVDGEVTGSAADWGTAVLNGKFVLGVGKTDTTISSSAAINDGAWHHLAATRDNTTGAMRVYVDGVLSGSGTGPTGTRTAPAVLRIGGVQGGGYFSGTIDAVYLYDRVLGPAEISALALAPTALSAAGGNTSVALTWTSPSPYASSFNIQRASVSGGPYTTVGTATATSYTDTGLTNGTAYFYAVSASNSGSETPSSAPASATPHPTFAAWQQQYFTPAQLADSLVSAAAADANGDGTNNIMAYAAGLSPWASAASGLPAVQVTDGYLTLTFTRRKSPADVSYTVKVSGDLAGWKSGASYTTETGIAPLDANTERVSVRDNTPASAGRRFIRLEVGY